MLTDWSEYMVLWPKVIDEHGVPENTCADGIPKSIELQILINELHHKSKLYAPGMRIHLSVLEIVTKRGFTGGRCSKSYSGSGGGVGGDDGAGLGVCLDANRRVG